MQSKQGFAPYLACGSGNEQLIGERGKASVGEALDGVEELVLGRGPQGWLNDADVAALQAAVADDGTPKSPLLIRSIDFAFSRDRAGLADLPLARDEEAARSAQLHDLCRALAGTKRVVAVFLQGPAWDDGAELAIAAGLRIVTPQARLALQANRVSRLPKAGSARRLSHLVGAAQSLRILLTGQAIGAAEGLAMGLFDAVIEQEGAAEQLIAAKEALRRMAKAGAPPRHGHSDVRGYLAAVAEARLAAAAGGIGAAVIDVIEAALLLSPDQASALEQALSEERATRPEAEAIAHLARAERQSFAPASDQPLVAAVKQPMLWGAEPDLAPLVLGMLARGYQVSVVEDRRDALVAMLNIIAARQEAAVQSGGLTAAQREAEWARLKTYSGPDCLAKADLVLLTADRGAELAALDAENRPAVCLALAGGAAQPQVMQLELHGRLAELAVPAEVGPVQVGQACGFLRQIGLMVVQTNSRGRETIFSALTRAGDDALKALLRMGVAPDAIASALKGFGYDIPGLGDALAAAAGQVEAVEPRQMLAPEILNRWLGAMANQAARLLAQGVSSRPMEIDLIAVMGIGLPRSCGGPLHHADQRGALILRRDLRLWKKDDPVWKPEPPLDALVSLGRGFSTRLSLDIAS